MNRVLAAACIPSARRLVRGLRFCAAAVAVHGMFFWLFTAMSSFFPDGFDLFAELVFWVLAVPALLLTSPFSSVLWDLGLMNAPGWFAWPKPLGFAFAYFVWIAVLVGLAQVVQLWSKNN